MYTQGVHILQIKPYHFLLLFITLTVTLHIYAQSGSNADMMKAIEDATDQAFTNVSKTARIAVIHIDTQTNQMSTFILNEIEHLLVTRGYNIVDRVEIDRIRQEQNLQYSGEVDDNTAVNLGKFIGADMVVTGAVTSIETLRRLRLKVIDTETTIIHG